MSLQRSDEWFEERLGKVTASRVADLLSAKPGVTRAKYRLQLALERVKRVPLGRRYTNQAMEDGIEREPTARARFTFITGCAVEEVGFIDHPTVAYAGCSPDGIVMMRTLSGTLERAAVLEIKCPEWPAHDECWEAMTMPMKHEPQVQWQMACTGLSAAHFVSFNPDFPEPYDFFHVAVERDDRYIAGMEKKVQAFLAEVAEKEKFYSTEEARAA